MKYLDHAFRGTLKSYIDLMEQALALQPEEYPYFPGVCPQWDNEARRPGRGMAYVGSTPAAYGAWLEGASRWVMRASQPDQRIVFINAWNEWAEGAYLEPDRHFGYAYLRETARVLARLETGGAHSSAVVEHPETAFVRMQESRSRRVIRRGSNILAAAAEGVAGLLRSV
jgi:lipopolysaccharide biosynthesis protein